MLINLQGSTGTLFEREARALFSTHVLDRQKNDLAIPPDAKSNKHGNRGRVFVEPHAHDRAVENESDDPLRVGHRLDEPGRPSIWYSAGPNTVRKTNSVWITMFENKG